VKADGTVSVNLKVVPFDALEQLVAISDQRAAPSGSPVLLLAANRIKLGRMAERVWSLPAAEWLEKNSSEFRQAFGALKQRSGKTILHENLAVARISDLALKVAVEKALGDRVVPLGEQHLAFPRAAIPEIERVVTKAGHVVKEVSDDGT
jgi:hypothetical protein